MTVLEQRQQALQRATEIRTYRSRLKERIARGETTVAAVLNDRSDSKFRTMAVADLLRAHPLIGRVKTSQILRHTRTAPTARLIDLTDRQATEIAAALAHFDAHPRRIRNSG